MQIQTALLEKSSVSEISFQLFERILEAESSDEDIRSICVFFLNSGQFQLCAQALIELLKLQRRLPWELVPEILSKGPQSLPKDLIQAMLKGAKRQGQLSELATTSALDSREPQLVELRKQGQIERQRAYEERLTQLKEKLFFLRDQQLLKEERKLLTELLNLAPLDPELLQAQGDFAERWAREVIARGPSSETSDKEDLVKRLHLLPEEKQAAEFLSEQVFLLAKKNPHQAYDLALLLWFVGLPTDAMKVLEEFCEPSVAVDWLKVEALLESHHYLDCLELLRELESRYGEDPETNFASSYAKAKALWGLKQGFQAIETIRSITRIRPNYRAAQSLLKAWSEEKVV